MDECIDRLGGASFILTLDAESGCWQIIIKGADKEEATFTSHLALYSFIRMPFGSQNAPGTFQRTKNVILSSVKWHFGLVALQDTDF